MNAFDRRTDRQTYGRTDRILIVRPRLHSMQRGKNDSQGAHLTICDLAVTLTFDLLTSKSNRFIYAPSCTFGEVPTSDL